MCPDCNGSGFRWYVEPVVNVPFGEGYFKDVEDECDTCDGRGELPDDD